MVPAPETGVEIMKALRRVFNQKKTEARPKAKTSTQENIPLPAQLRKPLLKLRHRYGAVAVGQGMAMMVFTVSVLLAVQALVDWWFEVPWLGRLGLLLADLLLLAWIYWRHIDRVRRKNLDLSGTALMVERKWPELRQCLITAVELAAGNNYSTRGSAELVERVFSHAQHGIALLDFNQVISAKAMKRWALLAGLALLGALSLAALTRPESSVLLARIFLSRQPLPTKTIVEPLTQDMIVASGNDVEIKVRAKGVIPSRGRVMLWYDKDQTQEVSLYPQPGAENVFVYKATNVQQGFKYAFYLGDGKSPQFTVSVRVPPVVSSLQLEQVYPEYTKLPTQKRVPSDLSLLAGSRLKIQVASSSSLRSATVVLQGLSQPVQLKLDGDKHASGEVPIPAKDLTGISIHLVDDMGVKSVNETVYPVTIIPDNPPQVVMTEPQGERQTVTLRAKPILVFNANDDYGLSKLNIMFQLVPPTVPGQEAPPPPPARAIAVKLNDTNGGTAYRYQLDLSSLVPSLAEGWSVDYWIEAMDNNNVTGPGVSKTERKQLAIVSPEEKQAEIFERLKQNADAIDNLSNTQQKISNEVGDALQKK
jgi:hypothetical protein